MLKRQGQHHGVSCQCVAHVAHGPRQHATGCIQAWNVLAHREAFAAWLPFWGVPFSYGVAISYVLVDTADKGIKAYQLARSELDANASLHPEVDTPRYTCLAPRLQTLGSAAQSRKCHDFASDVRAAQFPLSA